METKSRLNRVQLGLLLAPGLCIFALFTVYPIIRLLWMSFCDWTFGSMLSQPWIGLQNFRDVAGDPTFWTVFVNSVVYTLVTVPGQMAIGLFVAILLNGVRRFSVSFRVINYLPVITSWVIASLVFRYIFNTEGLLNYVLTKSLPYGAKRALVGHPMERHECRDDFGYLEGRRLEHGGVYGGAATGACRSV